MQFISNSDSQVAEMLATLGLSSVEELFARIPERLRLQALTEDDGLSEQEVVALAERYAAENRFSDMDRYLGGGVYEHHIPALVSSIYQKSGFLTSYTPYQAEASQGVLQTIFEFQSAVCALTGLDVANAGLYEGGSACGEALLMALRLQRKRSKVVIAGTVHPHYRAICQRYLHRKEFTLVELPISEGVLDLTKVEEVVDEETAAILVQSPNFFGSLEETSRLSEVTTRKGALLILAANPLSYGLLASAADQGADIAIGEMQALGIAPSFGGPYCGYIACREQHQRQLPGRIVGETVDSEGRPGFVLTLQAREQHIRREKATSNICTSQQLCALMSLVTILWYGKRGMREWALTNYQRAHYLQDRLASISGVTPLGNAPFFNEFVLTLPRPAEELLTFLQERSIVGGLPLKRWFPDMEKELLIAVTETKNREQLDRYCNAVEEFCSR